MAIESKGVCHAIKQDGTRWTPPLRVIDHAVGRLADDFPLAELGSLLGPDAILVPAPRSSILVEGALWPARRICQALVDRGLGARVWVGLRRVEAVEKSAFAAPERRPKAADHYRTMACERPLAGTLGRIVVVDDVITRGATTLGAVSRLMDTLGHEDVHGFGLVRTMSDVQVESIVGPARGRIELRGADTYRIP